LSDNCSEIPVYTSDCERQRLVVSTMPGEKGSRDNSKQVRKVSCCRVDGLTKCHYMPGTVESVLTIFRCFSDYCIVG
jgi:hypothetical protein